jgi:hypothetical protein
MDPDPELEIDRYRELVIINVNARNVRALNSKIAAVNVTLASACMQLQLSRKLQLHGAGNKLKSGLHSGDPSSPSVLVAIDRDVICIHSSVYVYV